MFAVLKESEPGTRTRLGFLGAPWPVSAPGESHRPRPRWDALVPRVRDMTPSPSDVHVLLVSAQAAPNLLPTLDPELRPREAVLVVSGKMKARADDLERVLREAGVGTSRVAVDNEHDLQSLEKAFLEIAESRAAQRIALNVTGGTKLMALAAQQIAGAADWDVFYVDVDTDEAIPLDKTKPHRQLKPALGLSHYLQAYGYRKEGNPVQQPIEPRVNDLLSTLVLQVGSLEKPLGQLNWLADRAESRGRLESRMSPEQLDSLSLGALIRNFEDAGLVMLEGDTLRFTSEAARAFVKGGWLERHVFRRVAALAGELGIRDKASNLVLVDAGGVKNELDVIFIARNRLFVIECKTARMDGDRAGKANDALFKLSEVCRRVGGLGTRAMLASYRRLSEAERRLAHALGIELACGSELAQLDDRLRKWIGG